MAIIDFKEEESAGKKPKTYIGVSVALLVVAALVSAIAFFGMYFLVLNKTSQIASLESSIEVLTEEENTKKEQATEALEVSKKVRVVQDMLENHICLSAVFNALEKNTVTTVYYDSFSFEGLESRVVLDAKALSYTDAANQLAVFRTKPEFFTDVTISQAAYTSLGEDEKTYVGFSPQFQVPRKSYLCENVAANK
ncbi:hypothetical protein KKH43_01740 [Patescibacteria group bacterium]|nr:hypothetical protein [Patescibacteria group bacterium]